ncbi:putative addiction module killer protein [Sphingomonas laterariae]|uniref:Putative addiction module killer protein n=1 Tax=Edaphosphingomonas laterariae TaxID=861865 RepID=A0A239JK99_9SPHN|nr:type II toxin-antitoxin system RelE/ParE family toxin [Sphingomonas laterariae]SNT05838.1 putative addiction module killer protein [Sphingomonas laterariae]
MIEVRQTLHFTTWFDDLRDIQAKARIDARIRRVSMGNFGDVKPVGEGVSELRIDYGPGYRVYLTQRGPVVVILLIGGDKSSQKRDIKDAKEIAKEL